MYITQIHTYVKTTIDQSDGYNLDVLYYFIRKKILEYEFSLEGVHYVDISDKYLMEPTRINFIYDYSSPKTCIALLMSLRAIRINPSILDSCNNDYLFFKPMDNTPYGWLRYCSVIINNTSDPDFFNLFCILEDFEYDGYISESHLEHFREYTIKPPCQNQEKYYRKIAESNLGNTKDVIIDNAFLNNSNITEYVIPKEVEYIGHTAFSYCKNLKQIVFSRKDTLFGKFPIIECPLLNSIIVPEGSEEYYKDQLAFYKDIIVTPDQVPSSENTPQDYPHHIEEKIVVYQRRSPSPYVKQQPAIIEKPVETDRENVDNIDIKKIEEIFKNKSTTYKYFWFMAILDIIKEKSELSINYQEIIAKMIALAWPFAQHCIGFGPSDNIPNIIQSLLITNTLNMHNNEKIVEQTLSEQYKDKKIYKIVSALLKNVPYRFLSPWIKYSTDKEVMIISQSSKCKSPYALFEDYILLDEEWYDYFTEHYKELYNMAKNELLSYLKKYNDSLKLLKFIVV